MIYFLALLPATALTIGGYLVLCLAARAEGPLRSLGKYLGFWAFTLAGLVVLGAIFAAAHGRHYCPFVAMHPMHEHAGMWPAEPAPRAEAPRADRPPPADESGAPTSPSTPR